LVTPKKQINLLRLGKEKREKGKGKREKGKEKREKGKEKKSFLSEIMNPIR
jgi:hypothetical protein